MRREFPGFSLMMVNGFTSCLKMADSLRDGNPFALLPVAPTFPPLAAHLILNDGYHSWVSIVHGDHVAVARLSV